jgi:hypothetical protein
LKKRATRPAGTKKLLFVFGPGDVGASRVKTNKSFWGAFFQKGAFLLVLFKDGLLRPRKRALAMTVTGC